MRKVVGLQLLPRGHNGLLVKTIFGIAAMPKMNHSTREQQGCKNYIYIYIPLLNRSKSPDRAFSRNTIHVFECGWKRWKSLEMTENANQNDNGQFLHPILSFVFSCGHGDNPSCHI